jgi:hypothetical protein
MIRPTGFVDPTTPDKIPFPVSSIVPELAAAPSIVPAI